MTGFGNAQPRQKRPIIADDMGVLDGNHASFNLVAYALPSKLWAPLPHHQFHAEIVRGTILFHEIGLVEQPYKSLGRSLRLELSVTRSQELLNLLPNGAAQFYCFGIGLPPHG
jgi:hypothetical protein